MIKALPVAYNGITYRSALEADWAATFDRLGIYYEYESHLADLGGEGYLCDFYLPGQKVWAEAKGPHNERIDKTHRLFKASRDEAEGPGGELVIVLRAADQHDHANWHHVVGYTFATEIARCGLCDQWSFTQPNVDRGYCRNCATPGVLRTDQRYIPAVTAESLKRQWAGEPAEGEGLPWYERRTEDEQPRVRGKQEVKEMFTERYGSYGVLPFVRVPRLRRPA